MANYLMTIDPIKMLNKRELADFSRHRDQYQTTGAAADKINQMLEKDFPFVQVFQSTAETHQVEAHEFMLADKTGKRELHKLGKLKTPSKLMAFVSVSDDWLKTHPKEAKAGAYFEMDPRIDPHLLHASDGATKGGKTMGFIRYGSFQTPVMHLVPAGPASQYDKETVPQEEAAAAARQSKMRQRHFKFELIQNAWREIRSGSAVNGFLAGWDLVSKLHDAKANQKPATESQLNMPHLRQMSMPGDASLPSSGATNAPLAAGLKELSVQAMEENDRLDQMNPNDKENLLNQMDQIDPTDPMQL